MAYGNEFIRITFGGSTAGNNEIWTCGLAIQQFGDILAPLDWFAANATVGDDYAQAVKTFFEYTDTRIPADVKLEWLKMALIGLDGKYMTEAEVFPITSGGQINGPYSPQDACVITLSDNKFRDPGKYNRFYLPTAGPAGVNEWRFTNGEQLGIATRAAALIGDFNDIGDLYHATNQSRVCVVSPTVFWPTPQVTEVRVGAIVDTQRRRRNKLSEDYVTLPVS